MEDRVPLLRKTTRAPALSYRLLCRRLKCLRMMPGILVSLRTMGELQMLAKKQYHLLAQQYHPDHREERLKGTQHPGHPLTGHTFRRIAKTYQWLMRFPPSLLIPCHAESLILQYPTPPIYEATLPFVLERKPLRLDDGFQEAMERYWY